MKHLLRVAAALLAAAWLLVVVAGDAAARRHEWANAVYYGATSGATPETWDLISSVALDPE